MECVVGTNMNTIFELVPSEEEEEEEEYVKALKDEWYVVIKAYRFTIFDIMRDFVVLSYIVCLHYPYHIESTNSMVYM